MNEPKPVYCIKSRGGRVEKEGTFAEIVAWLEERRIRSDDELRRLGFYVLEKDELWAQVRDFPEFKLTERQGRQGLSRAKRRAYWATALGIVLAVVGSVLIIYDQLIPRYTESSRVGEAQTQAKIAQASEAEAIRRQNESRKDRDDFRTQLEAKQYALNDATNRRDKLQKEFDSLYASYKTLDEQLRKQGISFKGTATELQAENSRLQKELLGLRTELSSITAELGATTGEANILRGQLASRDKLHQEGLEGANRARDYWKSLYESERGKSKMEKLFGD